MFDAILIEKEGDRSKASLARLDDSRLPEGDVTVRVSHSTLNYKDGLAITGRGPIVRSFPLVPGVDFTGVVEDSRDARFKAGDSVLLNGFGVGESHWGGLAGRARVSADWLIRLPERLSAARAMALGTAGYTAMLCVMALERQGVAPGAGEIIVTGAGGGVGGVAIQILDRLGYRVVASTGRPQEADYLRELGADEIIDRATLSAPGKPLAKARWAGAVDSLGSHTLANVCAAMKENGVVAACGLAQGMDFPATVAPFILRGVTLVGINSVYRSIADRVEAWDRLAREIDVTKLDAMTTTIGLKDAIAAAGDLIDGKIRGRIVVAIGDET
ncbi:quinone oxidoreductase, YhdH/YhfP family [Methylocella silvestris BL2]|uniref:Quinone oxidoreductase, YhdH/YhfP family n=1 Tax=Methylocella silvestris (strain DSM 15510 / CIP 108128 / LMG 27833 / NCIMB 13906 / BL2) TaxID=395965 RepID=B8EN71_METSB|nr:MDR family oxidoreductase [Methylocella silvestris]ACK49584.1 quinone oxidoreductase, YhdH/YhfP family [Methylocella silvestris BL2]